MCIIAAAPPGKEISKEILKKCWSSNPHGGGFMCTDGKQIHIEKEMDNFDVLYEKYMSKFKHPKFASSRFVFHFRIATHGEIAIHNCHPFIINNKVAFCHNGVINTERSSVYSDTYMFNETYLKTLPTKFYHSTVLMDRIKKAIGYSKLAFLTVDNKLYLSNEQYGVWDGDFWFSHGGYKPYNYYQNQQNSKKIISDASLLPVRVSDSDEKRNCQYCDVKLYTKDQITSNMCDSCKESTLLNN